ncbi:MAG TPA: RidA family protein [Candidatus Tumulicola sp.]|nr:RidA family protein [Candidatus Tumulicola sp.]
MPGPAERRTIRTGSRWEPLVGYARAVRVGNSVAVSGTVGDGEDAYQQTRSAIATIARALGEAGAALSDVVRTRIFVTDIERDWEQVARAHREAFADVEPACSMVEISRLIAPEFVVEIEADALTP